MVTTATIRKAISEAFEKEGESFHPDDIHHDIILQRVAEDIFGKYIHEMIEHERQTYKDRYGY